MRFSKYPILTLLVLRSGVLFSQPDSSSSAWSITLKPFIGVSYVFSDNIRSSSTITLGPYKYISGQLGATRKLSKHFFLSGTCTYMTIGKVWYFDGTVLYQTGNSAKTKIYNIYRYNFLTACVSAELGIDPKNKLVAGLGLFGAFNVSNSLKTDQYGDYKTTRYNSRSLLFKPLLGAAASLKYALYRKKHIEAGLSSELFYSFTPLADKRTNASSSQIPYSFQNGIFLRYTFPHNQ